MPIPPDNRAPGDDGHVTDHNAISDELTALAAGVAGSVPVSQSAALGNNTYADVFKRTVTGQTDDPLPPFGLVLGSLTFGSSPAVQGPAAWLAWNPDLLSGKISTSPHGAVGMSGFADAGDTNNGTGGHGLEWNMAAFRSKDGTKATNAIQMVAVDDNTNTVSLAFRCGTGSAPGGVSQINFSNSDNSVPFCTMDGPGAQITFRQQVNVTPAAGPAVLFIGSANDNAFGEFSAAAGKVAGFQFQVAGVGKASLSYDDSAHIFYITGPGGSVPLYASSTVCYSFAPWTFEAGLTIGGGRLTTTPVALADAATVTVNASLGNDFYVTLGGNRTLGAPSSPADRQIIRVDVIQPSSGGPFTLTYDAAYDFGITGSPPLSAAAGKVDTLAFRYIASLGKWTCLGSGAGY